MTSAKKKGGVGLFIKNAIFDQFTVEEELSVFHEGIFESILKMHPQSTNHSNDKAFVIGAVYLPSGLRGNKAKIFEIFDGITRRATIKINGE